MLLDFLTNIVTNIVAALSAAPAFPMAVLTRVHHSLDVIVSSLGSDVTLGCALFAVTVAAYLAHERRTRDH